MSKKVKGIKVDLFEFNGNNSIDDIPSAPDPNRDPNERRCGRGGRGGRGDNGMGGGYGDRGDRGGRGGGGRNNSFGYSSSLSYITSYLILILMLILILDTVVKKK